MTAAKGSTLLRCGPATAGPAAAAAAAPLAASPTARPGLPSPPPLPLPPAGMQLLLEAKGSTRGNPVWADGTRASRFYWAAPGHLSEEEVRSERECVCICMCACVSAGVWW